jgi:lysophospholipase L1-like esterase
MERRTPDSIRIQVLFWLVIGIVPFLLVEGIAVIVNALLDGRRPFLIDLEEMPTWGQEEAFRNIDPLLGPSYAANNYPIVGAVPFVVSGDIARAGAVRVVTLGGSTTDGSSGNHDWPGRLEARLREIGIPSVILNGGVTSYGSAQELLKLIRDVLPLKPDVVVAYDGVNDVFTSETAYSVASLTHPYLRSIIERSLHPRRWLLPNAMSLVDRGLSGLAEIKVIWPRSHGTQATNWANNHKLMHAICVEYGIRYLGVLQPAYGIGTYVASEDGKRRLEQTDSCRKPYKDFYAEASRIASDTEYIVNATQMFPPTGDFYIDHCHLTEEGNRIVAERIADELLRRKMLSRP